MRASASSRVIAFANRLVPSGCAERCKVSPTTRVTFRFLEVITTFSDAKVSVVDVRDIAASVAAALTGGGHAGRTYTLTGPEALSHVEIAAHLSHATGRTITFVDVSAEAMREALHGMNMPAWQAAGLIEDYAHYRRGEAAVVATGVQDATGSPSRPFADFARDYVSALS